MKILNLPNSIRTFLATTLVFLASFSVEAIPSIPEARIQCPGYFEAHALFAQDFSIWGPKLNKFVGLARVVGSGERDFEVHGHQALSAKQGDPVFWIFTLKQGTFRADVVLTQQHDWQSKAYGEITLHNGKKHSLSCLVRVDLNGRDQPSRPGRYPR